MNSITNLYPESIEKALSPKHTRVQIKSQTDLIHQNAGPFVIEFNGRLADNTELPTKISALPTPNLTTGELKLSRHRQ